MNEENDNICCICSDIRIDETRTFVCEHQFCQVCIVDWYKSCVNREIAPNCPLCRKIDHIWGT